MKQHMKLLGLHVKDKVTGFSGVVTTVGFDLYGCVQAIVTPMLNEKGEKDDGRWFDTKRLVVDTAFDIAPVMPIPTYESLPVERIAGGYEKPLMKG